MRSRAFTLIRAGTPINSEESSTPRSLTDRESVQERQESVACGFPALDGDRGNTHLGDRPVVPALVETISSLAGIQGRKNLIYVSEGLPANAGLELAMPGDWQCDAV